MVNLIETSKYTGQNFSVFVRNLSLPRHRWYEFKEGFSEALVREAISEFPSHQKRLSMLDPFVGCGTTLVTAGKTRHAATGIEINPFLAFASRAKCTPAGWDEDSFQRQLDNLLALSQHEAESPLEGLSTFTENPGVKKWLFNRSVLRGFAALDTAVSETGKYRDPLRLALLASLMECCNAKRDGKAFRYRKGWEGLGYDSSHLRLAFKRRARIVAADVIGHPFRSEEVTVLEGDARTWLDQLEAQQYDLVVTSPPYLNSLDYSDVYRPELFVGGFVKTNEELRTIRLQTIRSHVQVSWKPATEMSSILIPPLLDEISKRELWSKHLPSMIQSYFADMANVLSSTARLVKPGGQAWIVVSTSAYAGVEIPVDLILADIACHAGWTLMGVYVLRQLRSAGQHWAYLEHATRAPLRESLIRLKR